MICLVVFYDFACFETNMWIEESSLEARRILPDKDTPTLVKLHQE